MVTNINVIKSGGVMTAAMTMITRKAYLRYCPNNPELTTSNFPRKKAMTGS